MQEQCLLQVVVENNFFRILEFLEIFEHLHPFNRDIRVLSHESRKTIFIQEKSLGDKENAPGQ